MEKKEQLLIIKPEHELKFRGPFNKPIEADMLLKNPTNESILFKIKTTSPKRYCVRPNSGLLEPNNNIEVKITLQPIDFDPNEKNRHKFMVQSAVAPESELNVKLLWKDVKPEELMDSELQCVFEFEDENNTKSTSEGFIGGKLNQKNLDVLERHGIDSNIRAEDVKETTFTLSPKKNGNKTSTEIDIFSTPTNQRTEKIRAPKEKAAKRDAATPDTDEHKNIYQILEKIQEDINGLKDSKDELGMFRKKDLKELNEKLKNSIPRNYFRAPPSP